MAGRKLGKRFLSVVHGAKFSPVASTIDDLLIAACEKSENKLMGMIKIKIKNISVNYGFAVNY